jgi:hypothetical protein
VPTIDEMREVAKRRDALSAEWVEAFRSRDNKRRADIEAQLDGLRLENDVWKWLGALCDVVEAADELVPAAVAYIDAEATTVRRTLTSSTPPASKRTKPRQHGRPRRPSTVTFWPSSRADKKPPVGREYPPSALPNKA